MFSRKLWTEARSEKISLFATILFGIILGGFIIGQAWLLSTIITSVFIHNQTLNDVRPYLSSLLLIIFGRGLSTYAREISSGRVSIWVRADLRRKLLHHLQQVSPIIVSFGRTGEITTAYIQGVDRLDAYFRKYLPQLFISAILPIMVLWVVFPIDWLTGLVLAVTAPLIPLFMVLIGKQAEKETNRQWKLLGRLGGHFLEVLQGLKTLKAFGLSQSQGRVIKAVSDQYASITLKVLRIAFLSALALEILATISTAIIAVQIGIRLLYGQIELADSLFILILAPDFYLPLRQLGAAYHSGMEGIRAAESIFKILDMPTMAKPAIPQNQKMTDDWFMGEIRFKEIQLSYQDGDRTPLKGVNFSIPAYKKTAFVGATGSGKSTIIALLLKFIQPDAGLITISGMEFREIDSSLWRKQIAWVPQFPYLFNDTVTANLLIAKPSAGPEEVIEATQKANLHDFINSLPNGYMTKIGEGGERLSGGQAQRLAIARAFLKDSPLIIFDEPTKNLDVETIGLIDETVSRLIQNKTMITAAHRLSSIQNADQIIVLEDGNVVQVGRHDELIGNEGLYRKLVYRGEVEQ